MSINIARTFETGASIVRVDDFASWAPKGYKAKVLEGYKYLDNEGNLIHIIDYYWKLAEDQTATITTDNSTVIAALNDKIAELEKERDELKSLALLITPEVIDLIRCGIGGNYGGDRYIEKMEETHAPILARFKAIKESKS